MIEQQHFQCDSLQELEDTSNCRHSHAELRKLINAIQSNPQLNSQAKAKQMQVGTCNFRI